MTEYGLVTGLVEPEDRRFTINRLLELFHLDELDDEVAAAYAKRTPMTQESAEAALEDILNEMLDYAAEDGLMPEDTITYRDLFDTKIMGMLVPRPSEVIKKFQALYQISPKEATDYFYKLSRDTNYIRRYRIKKDQKWTADTEFGTLDITINLSKPEKDPKAIAAAKLAKQSGYPKCLLCKENEGYAGRVNHPARQNHRIIPVTINHSDWFFQYSPYVYYNEHCIVFNAEHTPMKIEKATFGKLLDFVEQFPHYFVGSNADLPIVGGSILSHDHFQGGHYEFAMAKAPVEKELTFKGFEDVKAGIVKWPMSVIRISAPQKERLIELADKILLAWRGYTDEDAFIFAETEGEPHNTITPIARKRGNDYELDLVLRNNITTEEHPVMALRRKKNSTFVVGMDIVRRKEAQAFVSAGSTGALMAGAMFKIGRIKGIDRPALATLLPVPGRPMLLVDAGANTDCQPKWIVQFAMMGSAYMRRVMNVSDPEVGLLNIGVEAAKGNEQAQAAYALMEKPQPFHFIGNVEARDALAGKADVVAADGFVGNVLLKNTEGVISMIFGLIKGGLMDSTKGKLAALLAKDTFRGIKRSFDSTEIGGAPLLGVEGAVIKAHGNSNARAIFCAIRQAKSMVDGGVVDVIRDEVAKLSVGEEQA